VFPCGFDDAAFRGESWIIATYCMAADRRAVQQCSNASVQQCSERCSGV
jgi:hypothetical protein